MYQYLIELGYFGYMFVSVWVYACLSFLACLVRPCLFFCVFVCTSVCVRCPSAEGSVSRVCSLVSPVSHMVSRLWRLVRDTWTWCTTSYACCLVHIMSGAVWRQDERAARMGAFAAVMAVKDETASVIVKDAVEVRDLSVLAVPRSAS